MATQPPGASPPRDSGEGAGPVVAAVDGEGAGRQFVIADISEDEAWLTVGLDDAVALGSWR